MAAAPVRMTARLIGVALILLFGSLFWSLHSSLPLAQKLARERKSQTPGGLPRTAHAATTGGGLNAKLSEAEVLEETLGAEGRATLRADLNGDGVDELLALKPTGAATGAAIERAVVMLHDEHRWKAVFDTSDPATWSLALTDIATARVCLHLGAGESPAEALARWNPFRVSSLSLERITVEPLAAGGQGSGAIFTFKWDGWTSRYQPSLKAAPPAEGALTPPPTVPTIDARPSGG